MKLTCLPSGLPPQQRGMLLGLTLVLLLIIGLLCLASLEGSVIQLRLASRSQQQQRVFEAAERVLVFAEISLVGNSALLQGPISGPECSTLCFTADCLSGYCFSGTHADDWQRCSVAGPALEPAADTALWAAGSGRTQAVTLGDPDLLGRYLVEYWCFTAADPMQALASSNKARLFRVTALATSLDGQVHTFLRSFLAIAGQTTTASGAARHARGRLSWEPLSGGSAL